MQILEKQLEQKVCLFQTNFNICTIFFFAKALSRKNHRINTVSVLIIDIMCLFD
jgi:hypothetical protein